MDVGYAILAVMILGLAYVLITDVLAKRKGGPAAQVGDHVVSRIEQVVQGALTPASPDDRSEGQIVDSLIGVSQWLQVKKKAPDATLALVDQLAAEVVKHSAAKVPA